MPFGRSDRMTHATKISFDDDDFALPKQRDCLRGAAPGKQPEIHCTQIFVTEELGILGSGYVQSLLKLICEQIILRLKTV